MAENYLQLGIQAARRGDKETATHYLAKAVSNNPQLEEGWLWLGDCISDIEKRKYCYERVLQLNPINKDASQRLFELIREQSQIPAPGISFPSKNDDLVKTRNKPEKKNNFVLWGLFGLLGAIVLFGLPLIFLLLRSPAPNQIAQTAVINLSSATPQDSQTQMGTKTLSTTPTSTATQEKIDLASMASPLISQAEYLILQKQYAQAIPLLDQAIVYGPNLDKPYYLRATCYHGLLEHQRSLTEFQDYIALGLEDIDMAVAIEPNKGDYYMLRAKLLDDLASVMDYRVDRTHLRNYVAENILTAINLGSTLEEYADRTYAFELMYAERCEDAVQLLQEMIDRTDPQDPSITGLYHIQSRAFSCLDNMDKAISMVKKSMNNPGNMDSKNLILATYLFQDGRENEALQIMNELIDKSPSYDGERYYLRAAINYELGHRDLAEQDLQIGAGNTWSHIGLYSYVMGKITLEDGHTQEGIELMQEADATLEVLFNPLRKRIQAKLKELGAAPLEISPSVMIGATSIPTVLPRPTARPFEETPPIGSSSNTSNATNIPGLKYPTGTMNAIVVDPNQGTGQIILKSGDFPLFRFQPAETIKVKVVKNIVVNVASFTTILNPTIQIDIYDPYSGGWSMIDKPVWGENPLPNPDGHVYPTGDLFIAIRNYGSYPVTMDNLLVTIIVETEDGKIIKLGP